MLKHKFSTCLDEGHNTSSWMQVEPENRKRWKPLWKHLYLIFPAFWNVKREHTAPPWFLQMMRSQATGSNPKVVSLLWTQSNIFYENIIFTQNLLSISTSCRLQYRHYLQSTKNDKSLIKTFLESLHAAAAGAKQKTRSSLCVVNNNPPVDNNHTVDNNHQSTSDNNPIVDDNCGQQSFGG